MLIGLVSWVIMKWKMDFQSTRGDVLVFMGGACLVDGVPIKLWIQLLQGTVKIWILPYLPKYCYTFISYQRNVKEYMVIIMG